MGSMGGVIFVTVMLIYRHWVIMAFNDKLTDIIAFGKCKVQYIKKPIQLLPHNGQYKSRAITQVSMS